MQRNLEDTIKDVEDIGTRLFNQLNSEDRLSLSLVSTTFDKAYIRAKKHSFVKRLIENLKKYQINFDMRDDEFIYQSLPALKVLFNPFQSAYNDSRKIEDCLLDFISQEILNINNKRYWFFVILAVLKELGFNFRDQDEAQTLLVTDKNLNNFKRLVITMVANRQYHQINDEYTYLRDEVILTDEKLVIASLETASIEEYREDITKLMQQDTSLSNQWIYQFIRANCVDLFQVEVKKQLSEEDITYIDTFIDNTALCTQAKLNIKKYVKIAWNKDERLCRAFLAILETLDSDEIIMMDEAAKTKTGRGVKTILHWLKVASISREVIPAVKRIFDVRNVILARFYRGMSDAIFESGIKFDLDDLIEVVKGIAKNEKVKNPIHIYAGFICAIVRKNDRAQTLESITQYFQTLKNLATKSEGAGLISRFETKIYSKFLKQRVIGNSSLEAAITKLVKYSHLFHSSKVRDDFIDDVGTWKFSHYLELYDKFLKADPDFENNKYKFEMMGQLARVVAKITNMTNDKGLKMLGIVAKHFRPDMPLWKLNVDIINHLIQKIESGYSKFDNIVKIANLLKFLNRNEEIYERIEFNTDVFLFLLKFDTQIVMYTDMKFACEMFLFQDRLFNQVLTNIRSWKQHFELNKFSINSKIYDAFLNEVLNTTELEKEFFEWDSQEDEMVLKEEPNQEGEFGCGSQILTLSGSFPSPTMTLFSPVAMKRLRSEDESDSEPRPSKKMRWGD